MGIANLRGALLPVVNLQGFLRGQPAELDRESRVLVIEQDEILSGLAVEEVFGVKHFLEEQRLPGAAASENWLSPYVVGSFSVASEVWDVFDVHSLIAAPAFMQVAA
jgi:twitching motility protein PilI